MKAIIVGAGVIGASIAFQLAKRGVQTTVIDAETPGAAASAASLAWINSNNKALRPYHDLSVMSIMEWQLVARELKSDQWLHPVGNLHVADTPESAAGLAERVARLHSYGYAAIPYPVDDLHLLDRSITRRESYEYAAFFPFEGYVSTSLLIHDLIGAAKSLGARFVLGERVRGLVVQGSQVCGARLESGEQFEADIVIAAAGAGLGDLLASHDINVRTSGTPGVSITTSPGASSLSTVLHFPALSIRPEAEGRVVVRSKNTDRQIDQAAWDLPQGAVDELFEIAGEHLNDFEARHVLAERIAIASRPYLFDGLPVVGNWNGLDGLYVTTMHSGVTLAAIVSRLVATEVVSGESHSLLDEFRPARVLEAAQRGVGYFDPYALEGEQKG
ncbi:NAD(P)/FAD-dependent oxidoreductase [Leucobacter denitrificans]|uniref:FAD-binding oxidoreductase n=1 Tax=Leucobacter denitrificans TaxID=683042 RepID=A0A7G9S2P3_9MICO|nr:FAD-binding oxidoreductase [Leucobacter denitrificans]QNN62118.1 FAD-binding oxidoreductase [Leucobacter denitrificans]